MAAWNGGTGISQDQITNCRIKRLMKLMLPGPVAKEYTTFGQRGTVGLEVNLWLFSRF